MPFISKQKGRMSHLLKQKSKVQAIKKEKITYEPFDFLPVKKLKDADGKVTQISQKGSSQSSDKKKIVPQIISKDVGMRDKS